MSKKTYFGVQSVEDYALAGSYPIVIEGSTAIIKHNKIVGNGAIVGNNNSKIVVQDLNRSNTDHLIKAIKNCWISYKDSINTERNFIVDNNSVVNFPKQYFNSEHIKRTGGVVSFRSNNDTNIRPYKVSGAKWSTNLISDGNKVSGMFWQEHGMNSFFYEGGSIDWHIVNTHSKENEWHYETITSPDTIKQYLPEFKGNNITINVVENSKNQDIKFDHVEGGLTLSSANNVTSNFTFKNISRLNIGNLRYSGEIILKNVGAETSLSGNKLSIYGSYIKTTNTPNYFDNFVVSRISAPDLKDITNKILLTTFSNSNIATDSNYNNDFLVRLNGSYSNFITEYNTQFIHVTNNSLLINNSTKYTLIGHSHKNIFAFNKNGTFDVGGIKLNKNNKIQDDMSSGNRRINGGINYDSTAAFGLRRAALNALPLGTIIGWYQINVGNKNYLPKVPYGFYDLTENTDQEKDETANLVRLYVDSDDPASNSFNLDFMNLFAENGHALVWKNGYIDIPMQNAIINGKVRILAVIKYNNNVTFRE